MSSPHRFGDKTGRITTWYNGSYNNKPFIPSTYTDVNGYKCVSVLPNTGALFYRMDKRLGFTGNESAADVFGTDRNTYFGIQPNDIAVRTSAMVPAIAPATAHSLQPPQGQRNLNSCAK